MTYSDCMRSVDYTVEILFSDNPSDEVHVTAGYVNSSAVAAEMYHVTGNVKVTDVLVAMRLNNSQLIHSRLHWRPELMADLRVIYRIIESEFHFLASEKFLDSKNFLFI